LGERDYCLLTLSSRPSITYLDTLAILTDGVQLSRRCRTWQHARVLAREKCLKNLVTDTGYELRFCEQVGWLNRLLVTHQYR